jgi:hypothetical protein
MNILVIGLLIECGLLLIFFVDIEVEQWVMKRKKSRDQQE